MTDDDSELALIRRKKMAKMMAKEKEAKEKREHAEKVQNERDRLLKRFTAPDAVQYLEGLAKTEPDVAKRIEEILLYLIVYRGFRQTIKQLDIRYIERQIKGEGPKIRVHRDGETSDFGSYVREAIKKGEE
ncbi:MAG: hypothetical protein BAJATHORv1_10146 [Candidatus Thorarchaeota archaeon]|nr:MAG: hypothetical protein BAJATHORv1_10146 [Candidatus Thorarchaeota archaeon]